MSDEDQSSKSSESETKYLTAEYKDGQLEIVEMSHFEKGNKLETVGHVVAQASDDPNGDLKYMHVLDSSKNVMVDLLNLTLVRYEDGQESYRLVTNDSESGGEETVTCVLSNDDGEEHDQESYVVMNGEEPVVILQSSLAQTNQTPKIEIKKEKEKGPLTPMEILERAKALQKARPQTMSPGRPAGRGRHRKSELPPPHELLSSPYFKLFLYSCKVCNFKCNAIKELTAHKAAEHGGGTGKWRGGCRPNSITLQCARCPYRGHTHSQLMKHVKEKHVEGAVATTSSTSFLDSAEVSEADVLVCGACGYESASRTAFKDHIENEHGVTGC